MLYKQEFDSINQFYKYICDTPINKAFRWEEHSSVENDYGFTKTNSFEHATELLHDGWSVMAQKLTKQLEVATKQCAPIRQQRNVLSVQGYQPVIPLYIAGVPTNMISKQMVQVKSKIVNVTKSINYHCGINTEKIEEESIKALQLVKQLESQGYRVNLSIALGTVAGGKQIVCKVRIKQAGERLNISKMAFPMVHPSMLRRLFFRYIEVCPEVTKAFVGGYGAPVEFEDMKKALPNEIVIPAIFKCGVDNIKSLETLKASV